MATRSERLESNSIQLLPHREIESIRAVVNLIRMCINADAQSHTYAIRSYAQTNKNTNRMCRGARFQHLTL